MAAQKYFQTVYKNATYAADNSLPAHAFAAHLPVRADLFGIHFKVPE